MGRPVDPPESEPGLAPAPEDSTSALGRVLARGPLRAGLTLLGPAFVASVAYVDPGNFATNFQAGSQHGYALVWVVVAASATAMLVQYLTSKLGLVTARSLPEVCRERYSRAWNGPLWVQAEIVAMATDLAEFTGAAVGLRLVFGIPLLPAGFVTAAVALGILALEQRGYRRFELAVIGLLAFVAAGFLMDFFRVRGESYAGIAHGLIPTLHGANTVTLAVGIIGATVMPHVVYLHSALQKNRIRPIDGVEARILVRFNKYDCVIGLGLAGLVNLSMLCIAATLFHHPGLSGVDQLGSVHSHLATMVGGGAALAFGVALIASGLSSSSVGTYAGQVVMAGFMDWHIPLLVRRVATMVPSLLVLALASNTTSVLVYSQIVLSFGIPFVLVPLTLTTSRRDVMGAMVNSAAVCRVMWLATGLIAALNAALVWQVLTGTI